MYIVRMGFSLIVQQYNGLEVETVKEPFGSRLGALVLLAVRLQREQSMTWVSGVFDNFLVFPLTPPSI